MQGASGDYMKQHVVHTCGGHFLSNATMSGLGLHTLSKASNLLLSPSGLFMTATNDGKTFEPLDVYQQNCLRMQHLMKD